MRSNNVPDQPGVRRPTNGWWIVAIITAAIGALSLWLATMGADVAEGLRLAIRFTARTSLLLFCLAFAAAALARLAPSAPTHWLRDNRRFIGLSFAGSHAVHAVAITAFAVTAPEVFSALTSTASFIVGGTTYVVIIAMAATSFDRTARLVGPRVWRRLHLVGGHVIWLQFLISYGMRIPAMPDYIWFLLPLAAAMALRVTAALRRPQPLTRN